MSGDGIPVFQEDDSNLQRILEAGHFSVSAEIGPPMSCNAGLVREKAKGLAGFVDAVNITDNQAAIVRMSSIAASVLALQEGVEPIVQMTCRDRNRIALQSDLLGAYALGLRNLLILSGDHQSFGNHPQAKNVYDIDSIQLLGAVHGLMENDTFIGGSKTKMAPKKIFLGATANPFAGPEELQLFRLEKKIRAGARFIQTQAVYNIEKFENWMKEVRRRDLHKKAYILAGVIVNRSVRSIEATSGVPGMDIPQSCIQRMRDAQNTEEEGVAIALELMEQLRAVEGVSGIHIMAIGWEAIVPSIVQKAGFFPRPGVYSNSM